MAKTLSTTKDKLVQLLNALDLIPSTKLATDAAKHIGFRKAIKKHLKEYLDAKAESLDKVRVKARKVQAESQKLTVEISKLEDENEKKVLENKRNELNQDLQKFVNEENDKLDVISEDLKLAKVEVVFDNEDYLFEKGVLEGNATEIFKNQSGTFNADLAENVFDLLEAVK